MSTSFPNPAEQQQTSANDTTQHSKTEGDRSPIEVAIVSQVPPTPNPADKPSKSEKTPRWKIVLEFFALFVAVVVALIYGGQLWVMKSQLSEMKATTISTQRAAYAACVAAQVARNSLIASDISSEDGHRAMEATLYQAIAATNSQAAYILFTPLQVVTDPDMRVRMTIQNTGQSEARNASIKVATVLVPRNATISLVYKPRQSLSAQTAMLQSGHYIALGTSSTELSVPVRNADGTVYKATANDIADMKSGVKDVLVYASATYTDMFGVRHWRHFCRAIQQFQKGMVNGNGHEECEAYNKADTNSVVSLQKASTTQPSTPDPIKCPKPSE